MVEKSELPIAPLLGRFAFAQILRVVNCVDRLCKSRCRRGAP